MGTKESIFWFSAFFYEPQGMKMLNQGPLMKNNKAIKIDQT